MKLRKPPGIEPGSQDHWDWLLAAWRLRRPAASGAEPVYDLRDLHAANLEYWGAVTLENHTIAAAPRLYERPNMTDEIENTIENLKAAMQRYNIPAHCRDGLANYIATRRAVGSFLTAVLSNDLHAAIMGADKTNEAAIKNYLRFLYMEAPQNCHGSLEKVQKWLKGES